MRKEDDSKTVTINDTEKMAFANVRPVPYQLYSPLSELIKELDAKLKTCSPLINNGTSVNDTLDALVLDTFQKAVEDLKKQKEEHEALFLYRSYYQDQEKSVLQLEKERLISEREKCNERFQHLQKSYKSC